MDHSTKSLVLVGCGHTHALALLDLRRTLPEHICITLIDPGDKAVYSGMLPGYVAGHYSREELNIIIANLTATKNVTFLQEKAASLDPDKQIVVLESGRNIPYDVASIDVGITSVMRDLPGFDRFAVPAKPLIDFAERWRRYLDSSRSPKVAVIGGGVAGAELIMAMSHAFAAKGVTGAFHLLDRGRVLNRLHRGARVRVLAAMQRMGITLEENQTVTAIAEHGIERADLPVLEADLIVGAAGASPHAFMSHTGLASKDGFVLVNDCLQTSSKLVFAVGDCAHFEPDPLPKAGVYAVRQAPVLAHNVIAALQGRALRAYQPQRDYLKLISLGGKSAVAEKHGFVFAGRGVWESKNWIDTGFMKRFA